ncbi:MAG: leucyl/phenylalanyl-tRNA--protein transferase [Spirochaetaceae bacterium]|nr:leucyl/phenylalanyl-tRNA--protein transferase [Spirochaetaceae bacterium]
MDVSEGFRLGYIDVGFPDPRETDGEIVAVGGDLSPEMLLSAYARGIFPWFSEDNPILWWSLDPRFVIVPETFHVSKSLKKSIRRQKFIWTVDQAFARVIQGCRETQRPDQDGTWITDDMMHAYQALHELGYAHSVESWFNGELAGGLYGVSLGGCYYGESMFARIPDASKSAFVALAGTLFDRNFGLIDCQQHTAYLGTFGARDMPKSQFLDILKKELTKPTLEGNWSEYFRDFPHSVLWDTITRKSVS